MAVPSKPNTPSLDNELLKQFVDNQRVELELRKESLQLQKTQLTFSHEYAMKALEAQKEDLIDQRKNEQKSYSKNIWIILSVIILFLLFGGYCLWIDKDEIIKELIKFLMYSAPFSVGGYFFGYSKGKSKKTDIGYQQEEVEN